MTMRKPSTGRAVLLLAFVSICLVSCDHVTGPSLTAEVQKEFLAPTTDAVGATSRCCCRVRGEIRNTSSIPVDISLRWTASDPAGAALGEAIDFLTGVAPSEVRAFDGAGIFAAC